MPTKLDNPPRRGLWVLITAVAAAAAILWALALTTDSPGDSASPQAPGGDVTADPTTTTTASTTTTAVSATAAPIAPATVEEWYIGGTPGPVLGEDVDGTLIKLGHTTMHRIDLATGEISLIELEHERFWAWGIPPPGVIVDGSFVQMGGQRLLITDLWSGAQSQPLATVGDGSFELSVVGRAGVDSVWLSKEPWPDAESAAIEVGLDGELRRHIDLPGAFHFIWGEGDDLVLESPEGFWRYDASTGAADQMPGGAVMFESGLAVTMSCDDALSCDVLADTGGGPTVVDWLHQNELGNTESHVSPDLAGLLLHGFPEEDESDIEFSYIDLRTDSRRDLGRLEIDPWMGIGWVGDSGWIVAEEFGPNERLVAIDTGSGDRVPIDLGPDSQEFTLLTYVAASSVDESKPDIAAAGDVFMFAEDDLCEWIDPGTVSTIVSNAYTEHGAAPIVAGFEQSWGLDSYLGCSWAVELPDPSDLRLSEVGLIRTESLDQALANGSVFGPHPALNEAVRVDQTGGLAVGGHGEFLCGMEVQLSVAGQSDTVEFWHCVPPDFDGDASAVLGIADGLLQEMGWVPDPSGSDGEDQAVFSFAKDDLCEWMSQDRVTSFVRTAYATAGVEWDGTAVAVPHEGSAWDLDGVYCRWDPTGGGYVIARSLARSNFGSRTTEFSQVEGRLRFPLSSGPVSGHPDFADDIIVANAAFGRIGFWLEDSDEALGLEMNLRHGVPDDDWAQQELMLSHVANSFLEVMGWTDPPNRGGISGP